jgi:hypothetical protein
MSGFSHKSYTHSLLVLEAYHVLFWRPKIFGEIEYTYLLFHQHLMKSVLNDSYTSSLIYAQLALVIQGFGIRGL